MAPTKQRFEKLAVELVRKISSFEPKDENFALCVEYVLSSFQFHNFLDVNSNTVKTTIQGLSDKFIIHSQKDKAKAFLNLTNQFLDNEIFKSHRQLDVQYSILAFLIYLANCPTSSPDYNTPLPLKLEEKEQEKYDWANILRENENPEQSSSDGLSDWTDSDEDEKIEISTQQNETSEKIKNKLSNEKVEMDREVLLNQIEPKLGRNWLKENVMSPYWAGVYVVKEPRKENACNKLNRQWEMYLQESGVVLSKNSSLVLTEYQVIRECLWLLHGSKDSFLFSNGPDKEIDGRVCLTHITNKSLHSMLIEISRYGSIVYKLSNFVDQICGLEESKEKCQTLEAYATSISHILTDLKEKILVIEKRVLAQNSIYTLSHLLTDLSDNFDELEFFNDLHNEGIEKTNCEHAWQRATKLIDVLYDKITVIESLGCGNNRLVDLFLRLVLTTIKPFIYAMDVWIREGILHDRYDEFILKRHIEINEGDEDFWNGATTIRDDHSHKTNPLLPDHLKQQFLQAGKSTQLLNRLGKMEVLMSNDMKSNASLFDEFIQQLELELRGTITKKCKSHNLSTDELKEDKIDEALDQLKSAGDYDHLLETHFRRITRSSPIIQTTEASSIARFKAPFRCLLNRGIQNAFSHLIYKKYLYNCSSLITVLKRDFCLFNYLSLMRKFFLMEAGDIMFNFYSQVFDLILNGQRWQDEVLLTVLLQDAIAAQYPNDSNCMSVVMDESPPRLHQSIELISSIQLNCKIPWPINIVVTNKTQRMYNQIFSFLLRVKWAKYSLDELRFQNLETSRASLINVSSEPNRRILTPRLYLLRMRLLHFVNNIHTYIMTQSLHTTGMELEERLNSALDLEQVVKFHSIYVDRLYHSCLLDDQMTLVRQAIVWVLNLAVNFRTKWDSGIVNCSEKDIYEMECEFWKCCKFLKSFHGNTTRSGSFVEWLYNFVLQDWDL